jgi:hypothetical protein
MEDRHFVRVSKLSDILNMGYDRDTCKKGSLDGFISHLQPFFLCTVLYTILEYLLRLLWNIF